MRARTVSDLPDEYRRCLNVLLMVAELHRRGFERLRIVPGMSPSGSAWRVTLFPASKVLRSHGAMVDDWSWGDPDPFFTSAEAVGYFGWKDAEQDSAESLADKFLTRFSNVAEQCLGADQEYARWFQLVIERARFGALPIAYFERYGEKEEPNTLPTTAGPECVLPMPPPGEKH